MRKAKAFTLIELLVVIAIIALLMAILVPVLGAVRKQARAIVCRSNQRQWGQLFCAYTSDYNGKWFEQPVDDREGFWSGREYYWFLSMKPYWRDCNEILLCPEAAKPGPTDLSVSGAQRWGSTFETWQEPIPRPPYVVVSSYGLNLWASSTKDPTFIYTDGYSKGHEPWETCLVQGAANVPVFFDSTVPYYYAISQAGPFFFSSPANSVGCVIDRHGGGVNMVFMDWSVRKVGVKEIWTLKWHRYFDTAGPWTKAGGVKPEDWPEWMRKFRDY